MANNLYDKARERGQTTGIGLMAGDIKVVLIDTSEYTFSAAHEFLSDIPVGARVAISGNMTNKSVTGGVFDADDVDFVGLTGPSVEAVALFRDTGVPETSELILYVDEGNFPIVPNGGDQTLRWSGGANKIYRL